MEVLKGGGLGENGAPLDDQSESEFSEEEEDEVDSGIVDLEDIAGKGPSRKSDGVAKVNGIVDGELKSGEKEMVTPVIRASLQKQVDSIIYVSKIMKISKVDTHP